MAKDCGRFIWTFHYRLLCFGCIVDGGGRAPCFGDPASVALATKSLGGHSAGFIRTEFVQAEGKSISIIRIAPSREPVFCKDGNLQRYYVRAGNTTRELDTREAIAHIHEKSGG